MTEYQILEKVAGIVGSQFAVGKTDVNSSTGPEEIEAWDSLTHVELTSRLETAFDVSFDIEEIMEMEDVGAIVRLISGKIG